MIPKLEFLDNPNNIWLKELQAKKLIERIKEKQEEITATPLKSTLLLPAETSTSAEKQAANHVERNSQQPQQEAYQETTAELANINVLIEQENYAACFMVLEEELTSLNRTFDKLQMRISTLEQKLAEGQIHKTTTSSVATNLPQPNVTPSTQNNQSLNNQGISSLLPTTWKGRLGFLVVMFLWPVVSMKGWQLLQPFFQKSFSRIFERK